MFPMIAQEKDSLSAQTDSIRQAKSLRKKNYSRPRTASIMSAILPGLGQVYNKKYWKVPIIYGGFAGFGYLFVSNNEEYQYYRKNLIAENDEDPSTINTSGWSTDQLLAQKVSYKKSRDFAAIAIGILYLLNVVDANVDAHLKTFDVSDDLSLHIEPWQNLYNSGSGFRTAAGLSLKLNFK
jgi:hypothetical protein